jgi:hypothetical protein
MTEPRITSKQLRSERCRRYGPSVETLDRLAGQMDADEQRTKELEANQQRKPTATESVCHACGGSGWTDD